MVALKRLATGGKESDKLRSRNAVVALKLFFVVADEDGDAREAGTPWWH